MEAWQRGRGGEKQALGYIFNEQDYLIDVHAPTCFGGLQESHKLFMFPLLVVMQLQITGYRTISTVSTGGSIGMPVGHRVGCRPYSVGTVEIGLLALWLVI